MVSLSPQQHRLRFGDTTLTKVFVGGLAWETPTHELRSYFEQFGEILEAVIITDKYTGKSKGYGFVTFRDPESAKRAVSDPNPYINGRRANCNIASMAQPRPSLQGRNQEEGIEQGPSHVTGPPYARLPAQMPPFQPQVYYPTPYGYMAYPSDYGYQQGMYNPQMTAQHFSQFYGTPSASVPSPPPYPSYPYVPYNVQSPRPSFRAPVFTHHPMYIQHPAAHIEGSYLSSPPSNFPHQGHHPLARQPAPNLEDSQAPPQQTTRGTNAESGDE